MNSFLLNGPQVQLFNCWLFPRCNTTTIVLIGHLARLATVCVSVASQLCGAIDCFPLLKSSEEPSDTVMVSSQEGGFQVSCRLNPPPALSEVSSVVFSNRILP